MPVPLSTKSIPLPWSLLNHCQNHGKKSLSSATMAFTFTEYRKCLSTVEQKNSFPLGILTNHHNTQGNKISVEPETQQVNPSGYPSTLSRFKSLIPIIVINFHFAPTTPKLRFSQGGFALSS